MTIFRAYLAGLGVAHLAWFYFFTTGHLLRSNALEKSRRFALTDLVITSVAGMALTGFGLLFLGFAHLLNAFGISAALLVEGILFLRLRAGNWLSWDFWRAMLLHFFEAWTIPALFIYLLFLILAVPAVLPPTLADSVTYHLAYAVDWANAGKIYVDPFLRFPYFANNFLLFYSALFILKAGNYCHFLTWLSGLLTCLGVLAFFAPVESQARGWIYNWKLSRPEQYLVPLCVALCPTFLRYLNVAYIDVPIGLFVLVPILCAYQTSAGRRFERELIVTGAFCAGMKLTLIGHVPFFLASLFFASARRLRWREITLLSLVLLALSLPWYIRNAIEAGDPAPPIFNFYFNHPDPIFSQADARIYVADTLTDSHPLHLLLLPFQFFTDPESQNFRETGVNGMALAIYALVLFLLVQLTFRRSWRPTDQLIFLSVATAYLLSPWFFSSLGRYSLHWYPTFAAWVGVIVSQLSARAGERVNSRLAIWIGRTATAVFCFALIWPTPTVGCMRFYRNYFAETFHLSHARHQWRGYLEKILPGYLASQAVIGTLVSNRKENSRVLALLTEYLAFYFRQAKIVSVGDYFGPAGYGDLFRDVNKGNDLPYLTRLDISAVIVQVRRSELWWSPFSNRFRAQLKNNRFKEYRYSDKNVAIFLRDDINPSPLLTTATE